MNTPTIPACVTVEVAPESPSLVLTRMEVAVIKAYRRLRSEQKFAMIVIRQDHSGCHVYATGAPIRVNE